MCVNLVQSQGVTPGLALIRVVNLTKCNLICIFSVFLLLLFFNKEISGEIKVPEP